MGIIILFDEPVVVVMKFVIIFAAICVVAYAAPFQESVLAEAEDMLLDMLKKEVEANKEAPAKKEVAPAAKKDAPAKEVPVKKEAAPVKREDVTGMSYSSCETRATNPAEEKPLVNRKLLRVNIPYPTRGYMRDWNGYQDGDHKYCTMSHDYDFYWNINTATSTCTSIDIEKCVCCSSERCLLSPVGESCPVGHHQATKEECRHLAEDHRSEDNAGC